jgi:hypothetical protein
VVEPVDEQRAVGEPGQPVVERSVRELLLQGDAVRDVARVHHDAVDGGVVEQFGVAALDPAEPAVAMKPVGGVVDQAPVPGVRVAAGEPLRQAGRLQRHRQLAGEDLEQRTGLAVARRAPADREHALRLAPAQGDPERVAPGVALDDDAVPP